MDPPTPNFYAPAEHPELRQVSEFMLLNAPLILMELNAMVERGLSWAPWPEPDLLPRRPPEAEADKTPTWAILPFCHTFPADGSKDTTWLQSANELCPLTYQILRSVPGIRTALFSRMAPGVKLNAHRGWAELANYVLRCHLPLKVVEGTCGVVCGGETQLHEMGRLLVFDDSKLHHAYNGSAEDRFVLIFDVVRPGGVVKGVVEGSRTAELNDLLDRYR